MHVEGVLVFLIIIRLPGIKFYHSNQNETKICVDVEPKPKLHSNAYFSIECVLSWSKM